MIERKAGTNVTILIATVLAEVLFSFKVLDKTFPFVSPIDYALAPRRNPRSPLGGR